MTGVRPSLPDVFDDNGVLHPGHPLKNRSTKVHELLNEETQVRTGRKGRLRTRTLVDGDNLLNPTTSYNIVTDYYSFRKVYESPVNSRGIKEFKGILNG